MDLNPKEQLLNPLKQRVYIVSSYLDVMKPSDNKVIDMSLDRYCEGNNTSRKTFVKNPIRSTTTYPRGREAFSALPV